MAIGFKLGGIVIVPPDMEVARILINQMGIGGLVNQTHEELGMVGPRYNDPFREVRTNSFETSTSHAVTEVRMELRAYNQGPNWMDLRPELPPYGAAALVMEVNSSDDIDLWKTFFEDRAIEVAQEMIDRGTGALSIVFETRFTLGIDIMFRSPAEPK